MAKLTKMCWWCKSFIFRNNEADWSDVTPGQEFSIDCAASIWSFDTSRDSQEKLGECLSTARTCTHFVPLPGCKEERGG